VAATHTQDSAIEALRAWAREHGGRTPTRVEFDATGGSRPRPCSETIRSSYFGGSWARAIAAAGLPARKRKLERWSNAKIEKELKADAKRRKRPPRASEWARATKKRPAAKTVAARYGGHWRDALIAAGLTVAEPRPAQWTRSAIVDAMLAWQAQHGQLPTSLDWKHAAPEHPCTGTVARVWKSWSAALEAARTGAVPPDVQLERQAQDAVRAFEDSTEPISERLAALVTAIEQAKAGASTATGASA